MSFARTLERLRAATNGARAVAPQKTTVLVQDLNCLLHNFDQADAYARSRATAIPAPEAILKIGRFLLADRQDNDHCTADPIFTVQKRTLITGIDTDITDKIAFFCHDSGGMVIGDEAVAMEAAYQEDFKVPDGYSRCGYDHEWRHVASYFTKPAAEAFIAGKRHEGEMRVYVDSAYRNHEWREVQAFLMALAKAAEGATA